MLEAVSVTPAALSVPPGVLGHRDASNGMCSWGSTLWPSDRQPPTQAAFPNLSDQSGHPCPRKHKPTPISRNVDEIAGPWPGQCKTEI